MEFLSYLENAEMGTYWLIFALLIIIIDVTMLFTLIPTCIGIAAFLTGTLSFFIFKDDLIYQIISFSFMSSILILGLYKPLKNYMNQKVTKNGYNQFENSEAVVNSEEITKSTQGKIKWSGTIVNAKLCDNSQASTVKKGDKVTITKTENGIFIINTTTN